MGIVFDLDGTLVDSTPDLLSAINAVLSKYNLEPSDVQENVLHAGNGLDAMFSHTLEQRIATYPNATKEAMKHEMLDCYTANPAALSEVYPGMGSLLEAIQKSNQKIAVLSNKLKALSSKILHTLFPSIVFSKIYGIDSGFDPKPDQKALLDFKTSLDPDEELIYVGDTEIDYETAQGVADKIYLVSWGYRGIEALLEYGIPREQIISDVTQLACVLNIRI